MKRKTSVIVLAVSLFEAMLFQPATAQPGYGDWRRNPAIGGFADQQQSWRRRYQREYSYRDDNYYQRCRNQIDPAGVIAGALIGGLLGNAMGGRRDSTGTTIAGVVVGGALGAMLTRDMNCEDQSYAYNSYYNGFNSGRTNVPFQWRNPNNGNYGDFRINNYYNDPAGFRCADFNQQATINRRSRAARGRACQQPDGTWAIVN